MANKVLLKRSSVPGKVPTTSDLDYGELSVNYADGLLYYKTSSNSIEILNSGGGGYGNTQVAAYLPTSSTITTLDANLGTATTNITTLFSNAATQQTQINNIVTTANANTAAYLPGYTGTSGITAVGILTGLTVSGNTAINNTLYGRGVYDNSNRVVSTSSGAGNLTISGTAITLPAAGPGAASVGSSTAIPVITTDAYGRVASTSTAAVVAPAGTLSGSTLASGVTASSLTSLGTLTTVTAGEITISGNSISSTNSVISIDPSTAGVGGTVVIAGNLQVTGTTTTINSTIVETSDLNVILAKDAINDAAANGAGITVKGANDKTFTYASSGDTWTMNKPLSITGGLTTSANSIVNSTLYAQGVYDNSNRVLTTVSTTSALTSVGTLTGLTVSGSITPNANLTVNLGSPTAYWGTSYAGQFTGNTVTLNAGTANAAVVTGNVNVAGWIMPFTSNATYNLGTSTRWWNIIYGKSVQAQYADLAENYVADSDYAPGTVVVFGGEAEVTVTDKSHDTRVAGVVSTNPAYLMNASTDGLPIAMSGRVPCQVRGPVEKGTVLVTSNIEGVAESINSNTYQPGSVLGKSLGVIQDNSIQTIEVVVGKF
jgi:hypothetical protein